MGLGTRAKYSYERGYRRRISQVRTANTTVKLIRPISATRHGKAGAGTDGCAAAAAMPAVGAA